MASLLSVIGIANKPTGAPFAIELRVQRSPDFAFGNATHSAFCNATHSAFCNATHSAFCNATHSAFCNATHSAFCNATNSAFCNATVQTRVISCRVVAVAEKKS